ncbi:hypothetical protein [Aureimonas sp. ME7]|uniref:hypothetical protein n=1 Tax=Aureimonas sp. ME7 TaxID=2744252 RepID=UPI0015FDC06D|nr:hypothetical protein [Aureimonas sp. ME7]
MPPTHSPITDLPASSRGGFGADARSAVRSSQSVERASNLNEAANDVEDILRREPDFAEEGEMERIFAQEDDSSVPAGMFAAALMLIGVFGLIMGFIAGVAFAPLVLGGTL